MKFPSIHTSRHIVGLILIIIAVAVLIYDFFSPPVGQLSNFSLILFAKLTAIAGSLLNINIPKTNQSNSLQKDEEI